MNASPLSSADLDELLRARALLDHPGLTARLSNLVGSPLERGMARLPERWRGGVGALAHDAHPPRHPWN